MDDRQHDFRASWSGNTPLAHLSDSSLLELWRAIVTELSRRGGNAAPICSMRRIQLRPLELTNPANDHNAHSTREVNGAATSDESLRFPCRLDFCITSPGHNLDVRSRILGLAQGFYNAERQLIYDLILDEPFTVETPRLVVPFHATQSDRYVGLAESYCMDVTVTCLDASNAATFVNSLGGNIDARDPHRPASQLSVCATLPDLFVCPSFDVVLPLRSVQPDLGILRYGMSVDASWTRQLPLPRQGSYLPCLAFGGAENLQHVPEHVIEYTYVDAADCVLHETGLKCVFCEGRILFVTFDALIDHFRTQHQSVSFSVTSRTITNNGGVKASIFVTNPRRHSFGGLASEFLPLSNGAYPPQSSGNARNHEANSYVERGYGQRTERAGFDGHHVNEVDHDIEMSNGAEAAPGCGTDRESEMVGEAEPIHARDLHFIADGNRELVMNGGSQSAPESEFESEGGASKKTEASSGIHANNGPADFAAHSTVKPPRQDSSQPIRNAFVHSEAVMSNIIDLTSCTSREGSLEKTGDRSSILSNGLRIDPSSKVGREVALNDTRPRLRVTATNGTQTRERESLMVKPSVGSASRRCKRETTVDELNGLISPKRVRHTLPDIPGVTFYHASSKQAANKDDYPGEGEGPAEEMRFKHGRHEIFVRLGLNEFAMKFHNAFHRHLDLEKPTSHHYTKDAIIRFARKHRTWLRIPAWRTEFETKLDLLAANRIIDQQVVHYCLTGSHKASHTSEANRVNAQDSLDTHSRDSRFSHRSDGHRYGINGFHVPLQSNNTSFRTEVPESPDVNSTFDPVSTNGTPTSSVRIRRPRYQMRHGELDQVDGQGNTIANGYRFDRSYTPESSSTLRSPRKERMVTPSMSPYQASRPPMSRRSAVGLADFIMGRTPETPPIAEDRFNTIDPTEIGQVCFCGQPAPEGRGSVACNNTQCVRETFHLACVGLARALPLWKCSDCNWQSNGAGATHDRVGADALAEKTSN